MDEFANMHNQIERLQSILVATEEHADRVAAYNEALTKASLHLVNTIESNLYIRGVHGFVREVDVEAVQFAAREVRKVILRRPEP